jgi:hypothetical protein
MWNFFKKLFGGKTKQPTQAESTTQVIRVETTRSVSHPEAIRRISKDLHEVQQRSLEELGTRATAGFYESDTRQRLHDAKSKQQWLEKLEQMHRSNPHAITTKDLGLTPEVERFQKTQRGVDTMRKAALAQAKNTPAVSNHHGLNAQQALLAARQQEQDALASLRRIEAENDEARRRRNNDFDDSLAIVNAVNAVMDFSSATDTTPNYDGAGGTFDGGGASSNWD